MLEEPRPEDVGGHFGEDAAFLLVLLAVGIVVIFARAVTAADAGVAGVTCETKSKFSPSVITSFYELNSVINQRLRARTHTHKVRVAEKRVKPTVKTTPGANDKWNKSNGSQQSSKGGKYEPHMG